LFYTRVAWTAILFVLSYVHATIPNHWLRWGLLNFCLGLALNHDLPISSSQVARITGVSHCPWLRKIFKGINNFILIDWLIDWLVDSISLLAT
jgi:hypothetical protein